MITVEDFTNAVQFKITGGSSFTWDCFGPDARWLDAEENGQYSASIVFGGPDFTVYVAEAHDYGNNRSYRWINPNYLDVYTQAHKNNGTDMSVAWDDHRFTDLDVEEDFIEKCTAIVAGTGYDDRVRVPLDIPDADLLKFMMLAHERDMTFNQLVEEALRAAIEDYQRDPEGTAQRLRAHIEND